MIKADALKLARAINHDAAKLNQRIATEVRCTEDQDRIWYVKVSVPGKPQLGCVMREQEAEQYYQRRARDLYGENKLYGRETVYDLCAGI